MDAHSSNRTPQKARVTRRECCDHTCTSGSRNNYFPGKRLTPDGFRIEQKYLVDRRHLLNRAIHGWGVVYGYAVAIASPDKRCSGAEPGMLEIGAGLALDKAGRELVQTAPVVLRPEDVILLDDEGAPVPAKGCNDKERFSEDAEKACWLLKVHYAEEGFDRVTLKDSCSCERTEWDRVCETVRYTIQRADCGECCVDQGCEVECNCATGPCCERPDSGDDKLRAEYERLKQLYEQRLREAQAKGARDEEIAKLNDEYRAELRALEQRGGKPHEEHRHGRGGCRCLCDHLTNLTVGVECDSLREIDRCTLTRVDLHNGVALACVTLGKDECGGWQFASVYDACGPRRLVKRNDLLFDLINGCDVTRIIDTGWKSWHRSRNSVPFRDFSDAFGAKAYEQAEYVTRDFWVRFSRPVRIDTLQPDAFIMTVYGIDAEGGWWMPHRVPIVRIESSELGDPPGHARVAKMVVDGAWLEDAIRGRANLFRMSEAQVEIEVRGDFIVDCNDQTVDANAHGRVAVPTGSDGPGDTYISTFTVGRSDPKQKNYGQTDEGVKS